jgi:hypothetical protein
LIIGGELYTVHESHQCTQATSSPKNLSIPGHTIHTFLGIIVSPRGNGESKNQGMMESLVIMVEVCFILDVFVISTDESSLVTAMIEAT